MDDKEFNALRIRASLCPGAETYWHSGETRHWACLHACKDQLRGSVAKTLVAIEAVNMDKSLSDSGKRAAKEKIGTQALNELETETTLVKAREAVEAQMKRWSDKIAAAVKPPADHVEAVMFAQVREKVAGLDKDRFSFLKAHGAEPTVAAALLSAPPFLSNLSEAELTLLRNEIERKYLGQEVVEAKAATERAYSDCVAAQRAAKATIAGAAGLDGAKPLVKVA